jgi:hypothetical protein
VVLQGSVDITAGSGFGAGTYDLFNYNGAMLALDELTVGTAPAGYTYQLVDNPFLDEIQLIVTPSSVPEPPSAILAALGLAAAGLAAWRRRAARRRAA